MLNTFSQAGVALRFLADGFDTLLKDVNFRILMCIHIEFC